MSANLNDAIAQVRQRRIAEWRADPERSARVRDVCSAWLNATAHANPSPEWWCSLKELPTEAGLPSALRVAGEPVLADALAWAIDIREGRTPTDAPAVLDALASAAGQLYADSGPDGAEWLETLIWRLNSQLWEDFANAAAERFKDEASRRAALIEYVDRVMQRLVDDPQSEVSVLPRGRRFQEQIEHFATRKDFDSVWHFGPPELRFRSFGIFEILRRTDEARYMHAVNALPHPWLTMECFSALGLRSNFSGMVGLLRLAAPAFGASGDWLPSGPTLVLLLREITNELLTNTGVAIDRTPQPSLTHEAWETGVLKVEAAEFHAAVGEVLDVLQTRPDADVLGVHWLSKLLRWGPVNRQVPNRTRVLDRPCLLVHALSSRLLPMRDNSSWVSSVPPMERPYRVAAMVCVSAFGAQASGEATGSLAQNLMLSARQALTGSFDSLHEGVPVLSRAIGLALAKIPNFAAWFSTSWRNLRYERERSWRASHDGGKPNPAEIMVVWGLGAVDALTKEPGTSPTELRAAWGAVEHVIREGRLVEPRLVWDFWGKAIARQFGYWRLVFEIDVSGVKPQPTGSAPLDDWPLAEAIAPYLGSTKDFMHVAVSLYRSGVTSTELCDACRSDGEDLATLVGRFLETARRLEDARIWDQEWLKVLRRIESDARIRQLNGPTADEGAAPVSA